MGPGTTTCEISTSTCRCGLTNEEIGRELHLSPRTVSTYLYQIFPKLNFTSRAGLRDALSARARTSGNDSRFFESVERTTAMVCSPSCRMSPLSWWRWPAPDYA